MTGSFVVRGVAPLQYQEFRVHDEEWPPRFAKVMEPMVAKVRGAAKAARFAEGGPTLTLLERATPPLSVFRL